MHRISSQTQTLPDTHTNTHKSIRRKAAKRRNIENVHINSGLNLLLQTAIATKLYKKREIYEIFSIFPSDRCQQIRCAVSHI